ncbi:NADH-quinone oxidoreductase subunit L [Anatilimnocola aggregata]|uniref:NADH-quinone oxidoreductase subunit L n=1 Tax=Anatilimnocola aggregata TaxID=2528021 RepID=A0A517YE30_9BACT|nr:proton-conducting transporter membrane subunit [Anatilimnocola aggregata]QDU28479.1 NADH-quinone oxidoreductase subunit L [Anatilimnocola aggregata]
MDVLPYILAAAVLLPLASFFVILLGATWLNLGKAGAFVATGAILGSAVLSFIALLFVWLPNHFPPVDMHGALDSASADAGSDPGHSDAGHDDKNGADHGHSHDDKKTGDHGPSHADAAGHGHDEHEHHSKAVPALTGEYYLLGQFGKLRVTISYYIDSLTLVMFCMVTLIASCIHFYAIGYMHDELHDITDHEVTLSDGSHLRRPGRFPRFFQALSLFCFSMLGLVLAGNIAMVFCFWELVGICSYFLIGFYVERNSASTAANKAFIVNRVGDFGMIIGLLALWSSLGTFAFGDIERVNDQGDKVTERGLFSLVRPEETHHQLQVPTGMVLSDAKNEIAQIVSDHRNVPDGERNAEAEIASRVEGWRSKGFGYWLLVVAGIGIFCGCVGKSAQFPLHVWLPDAMEGPTPVSALVHSATMVAAGVYLVGRFFPVFLPEVLLVIATIGAITLFMAATIAITANDIKRVLAYSTVSQLGYMMLSLGVGGWKAGLMHLITHAFFKSLLFMCSGSVIHAVHTNDMRKMGGLLTKMPVTAITMLIGCLAIAGVGVPFLIGFSGYYSKDMILEQALSFWINNPNVPWSGVFFIAAAGGAAVTAFYMFRMWYMTFVGKPRDAHAYDHAHESPPVMYIPLVILSVFAIAVAWNTSLLGFGAIAAAFFIAKGFNEGWFKGSAAGHGHDAHGHDDHAHGHDDHGHAPVVAKHDAHGHDSHGHGSHSHDDHAHHGGLSLTMPWVLTMLVASLVGGTIFMVVADRSGLVSGLTLGGLLDQSEPLGLHMNMPGVWTRAVWPTEHFAHDPANFSKIVAPATLLATGTWLAGIGLATLMYGLGYLNPADVRKQFSPIYNLLVNKYYFDELYNFIFVQPTLMKARLIAGFDRRYIDGFIDWLGRAVVWFSKKFELIADRGIVDGSINIFAGWTYSTGLSLRSMQTGHLRQYVMFIIVGAIAIFVLISFFWTPLLAR